MTIQQALAEAIKATRKHTGLTQEDFSNVSSRTYISSLERGLKCPTVEKLDEIAGVMGVHPLTILTLTYLNQDSNIDLEQLQQQIANEITTIKTS